MARTDLGDKQTCPNCGARFYDLRKRPAVCPKCTTAFDPSEEGVRSRRTRSRVSANDPIYKDEDEEVETEDKARSGDEDEDEEEGVEETSEVDAEGAAEPLLADEDEDEEAKAGAGEELPEGFSEDEADLGEDAADDDSVPMLEDDEEFSEDELGELPGGDDENER